MGLVDPVYDFLPLPAAPLGPVGDAHARGGPPVVGLIAASGRAASQVAAYAAAEARGGLVGNFLHFAVSKSFNLIVIISAGRWA